MRKPVLLTGCTGLLGRYLLRNLILAGVPVAVVVRPEKRWAPSERIEAMMGEWEGELGRDLPRPVCLEGDLTRDRLGLDAEDRAWVARSCDRVLHSAASLTFAGKDRGAEPWVSNLTGTENVLELCKECRVREFHYVSTAYVCGKRVGTVYEAELDLGQGFRNDYEQSKLEAESLARRCGAFDSVTVYRPAVIVGDSRTGYTSTYHGPYRYFQFTAILHQQAEKDADGRWHHPVRLEMTGDERLNLVPVDWVAEVITNVVETPRLHGLTYHLTPRHATRSREIEGALANYFDYFGVEFVGPRGIREGSANAREAFFYEYSRSYEDYLRDEPVFDSTNTRAAFPHLPCPRVDTACLRRLIDFGMRDQWGKRRQVRARATQG